MRILFNLLIIIFLCKSIIAQEEILYQPIFINSCDTQEEHLYLFLIDKQGNLYEKRFDSKNIKLPHIGQYRLHYDIEKHHIIDINSRGVIKDTFFLPSLSIAVYLSNPPFSEYYYCADLAEGKIIDYYWNGNIRSLGKFKKGQPIDTLTYYYNSGSVKEIFIPYKKSKYQSLDYYRNGKLKRDLNTKKRYERINYPSGQLAKYEKWNKKYQEKIIEYYQNGVLKLEQTSKILLKYSEQGKLTDEINRMKFRNLYGIFNNDPPYRKRYKYKWTSFNKKGERNRVILFKQEDNFRTHFPKSLKQIFTRNIDQILFYKNNKETHKMEFTYIDYNTQNAILYQKINDVWKEIDSENNKEFGALIEQLKHQ